MKIATITEMKQRNKIAGGHFFDRESMKFWGAKIHTAPNKYGFFLESHDSFDRSKKLYTIRAGDRVQINVNNFDRFICG